MEKFVCNICGYVYDPAKGDPDNGVAPGTALPIFPNPGSAPTAAPPWMSLRRQNEKGFHKKVMEIRPGRSAAAPARRVHL